VPIAGKAVMTVDLGSVTRCNSMGVMRWARFLKTVPPTVAVRIVDCSSILLKQFNIYPGFLGHPNLTVEAFQTNYLCRACDANHKVALKAKSISRSGERFIVPPQLCPTCRKPLELDGIPETLFLFIGRKTTDDGTAGQGG
jgi:hypothetical protein